MPLALTYPYLSDREDFVKYIGRLPDRESAFLSYQNFPYGKRAKCAAFAL